MRWYCAALKTLLFGAVFLLMGLALLLEAWLFLAYGPPSASGTGYETGRGLLPFISVLEDVYFERTLLISQLIRVPTTAGIAWAAFHCARNAWRSRAGHASSAPHWICKALSLKQKLLVVGVVAALQVFLMTLMFAVAYAVTATAPAGWAIWDPSTSYWMPIGTDDCRRYATEVICRFPLIGE